MFQVETLVLRTACLCLAASAVTAENERPIIGVIAQETTEAMESTFPAYGSFIVASYVKAIESSGARVVPILIGQTDEYYEEMFQAINGLVIPGGAAEFNGTNNYYSTSRKMYQLALRANMNGDYFPILGVCLGYEVILTFANNERRIRKECQVKNVNLPLEFVPGFQNSSLYRDASDEVIKTLHTKNVTVNWHKWCVYPADLMQAGLYDWRILSVSTFATDLSSNPFISSIEHTQLPFAGIQFHPEKVSFEWSIKKNYPHSSEAIQASRHFYDWIVKEARKSDHYFSNSSIEYESLIYNYNPTYTDKSRPPYTQMYLFEKPEDPSRAPTWRR